MESLMSAVYICLYETRSVIILVSFAYFKREKRSNKLFCRPRATSDWDLSSSWSCETKLSERSDRN